MACTHVVAVLLENEKSDSTRSIVQPWRRLSQSASSCSPYSQSSTCSPFPTTPQELGSVSVQQTCVPRREGSIDDLFLAAGLGQDFQRLSLKTGVVDSPSVRGIGPEIDKTGHIEYKLRLLTPTSPHRLQKLITQLKWRLVEGGGTAIYELGVLDSGTLVGLNRADMQESLSTLGKMLSALGGGRVEIARVVKLGANSCLADSPSPPDSGTSSSGSSSENESEEVSPESSAYLSRDLMGFKTFEVSDSVDSVLLSALSNVRPIPILPVRQAPHPQRSEEERTRIRWEKREARRIKRQQEAKTLPTLNPAPENEEFVQTTKTWTKKTKPPIPKSAKVARNSAHKRMMDSPRKLSPLKPKPPSEEDQEEKFVIEAIIHKRVKAGTGEINTAADVPDDCAAQSDAEFDSEEVEGWNYIDFDSLPAVRSTWGRTNSL